VPPPRCPQIEALSVAEADSPSPVAEEHEEHDQADDRGDGQPVAISTIWPRGDILLTGP
jgi:hypothetical protein